MAQQKCKNKINHRQRQGDWICSNCNNMNFAFRDTCNRCQTLKNQKDNENKGFKSALFLTESKIIKETQQKYDLCEFEWQCQKCEKINQYYKIHCAECGAQRGFLIKMVKILFFLFSILEGGQDNERHTLKQIFNLIGIINIDWWKQKNELKSIEFKNNNSTSISSRPLVFCKPEPKLKTQTTSSPQKQSPIKPKQVETQSNELCKLINNYSEPILDYYIELNNLTPKNCLSNHTVSANLRAKMVDWMVEVLTSYKCKDQTFFFAVKLMDTYLSKTQQKHIPQDLHLIGVTTMFMSCKYKEIYPVKLQIVHEKIAHKNLTKDEIKDKETYILRTLIQHYSFLIDQQNLSVFL